jgi:serine/threonine-protein kinase RsbW
MKHKFTATCSKNVLRSIRSFIAEVLLAHRISEVESNMIILAVDEVCSNLIIHAHHCNPEHLISLNMSINEKTIEFEIFDEGEMFNFMDYKVPSVEQLVKDQRKGGMGIMLVKKIMDEISFTRQEGRNVCKMVKYLSKN